MVSLNIGDSHKSFFHFFPLQTIGVSLNICRRQSQIIFHFLPLQTVGVSLNIEDSLTDTFRLFQLSSDFVEPELERDIFVYFATSALLCFNDFTPSAAAISGKQHVKYNA